MAAIDANDLLGKAPPGAKDDSPEPVLAAADTTEVSVEDDDDDEEPEQAAPQERPPRQDRRHNRFREAQEARERAEREAEMGRIRAEQAERRAAALEAQLLAGRLPDSKAPSEDAYRKARRDLVKRQTQVHEQYAALSEEEQVSRRQEFEDRLIDLEDESKELYLKHKAPQQSIDPKRLVSEAQAATFAAENQDVMGDPRRRALMSSIWTRMTGYEQKPRDFATARAAVAETRRQLGLAGPTERTSAEKARFGGLPRQMGGGGGGGSAPPKSLAMNRDMRRMAEARYPDLPAEKAHKKWAKAMMADDEK